MNMTKPLKLLLCLLGASAVNLSAQTTQPSAPPPFVIGVWAQPVQYMQRWKDRGANTLFGAANDTSKEKWEAAASSLGMSFIDYPGVDPVAESKQAFRVGFLQPDEPDMPSHVSLPGSTMEDLRTSYARLKALSKPVYLNLLGSAFDNLYYDGTPHPGKTDGSLWGHRAATDGYMGQCDVVGFDYHLWTSGRAGAFEITRRLMDRCHDWSAVGGVSKPMFVYVETCTQGTGRAFTADDFEAQVMQAVCYAAMKGYALRGVIYFATATQGGGSWPEKFDATPPDVAARMSVVNAKLSSWGAGKVYGSAGGATTPPVAATRPSTGPALSLESLDSRVRALEGKQP